MKNEKTIFFAMAMLGILLVGCGKPSQDGSSSSGAKGKDASVEEEEEKLTPVERKYIDAAKTFAIAIASRKYDEAFALLSTHATARMSLNQFSPEDDDTKFAQNEKNPTKNVTIENFRELMKKVEVRYGTPRSVEGLSVFSTDADILNRRGKEQLDAVDSMFAIGNMPESIPADTRRASIRGKILTQLSQDELAKVAKEHEMTVEDLQKNEDFEPYFTIKLVMIEQEGQLKVGYFEFLPPGIMD